MNRFSLRQRIEGRLARALLELPEPVLARLTGRRATYQGATIDAQVALAIALHRIAGRKHTHELSVAGARAELEVSTAVFAPKAPPLASIGDRRFRGPGGDVAVRIYRPRGAASPAPALVYLHGGGFVVGSLDSHDATCRVLAAEAGCVVVSVDYRLAPEHPFPAAVEDAIAAFRWVAEQARQLDLDPSRIAVGGDSAGGNLSAVVALETRADARRPCFQLLTYPATDMTLSCRSIDALGTGFFLERATIDWFLDRYMPPGRDRRDPRASPLFARDLAGLPPAFVLTAGFDPLRDEGEAYARKLAEAGVAVTHRCYETLMHGFFNVTGSVRAARAPLADAVAALRRAFAAAPGAPAEASAAG